MVIALFLGQGFGRRGGVDEDGGEFSGALGDKPVEDVHRPVVKDQYACEAAKRETLPAARTNEFGSHVESVGSIHGWPPRCPRTSRGTLALT